MRDKLNPKTELKFVNWYYQNYKNDIKFYDLSFEFQLGVFLKFITENGFSIAIQPEYYTTGINFNYQIFWYTNKLIIEESINDLSFYDGTSMYGDNGEFSSLDLCYKQAIIHSFNLIEI